MTSPRQTSYAVNDVYPCIQGEGTLTGTPMLMVRLQGCPVGCAFCDTKETWAANDETTRAVDLAAARGVNPRWAAIEAAALVALLRTQHPALEWVLVSGGEPLLQDCTALTAAFRQYGYRCAVETSGTAPVTGTWDFITVSPKIGMPGGRMIVPATIQRAEEIKWVVGKAGDLTALHAFLIEHFGDLRLARRRVSVAVQPLSLSPAATQLAEQACLDFGWRLSIQTHKLIHADWKTVSV